MKSLFAKAFFFLQSFCKWTLHILRFVFFCFFYHIQQTYLVLTHKRPSYQSFLAVSRVMHVPTWLGNGCEIIACSCIRHLSLMTLLASEISLCLLWHQFNLMEELWSKWLKIKHYPQCRNEHVPAWTASLTPSNHA